MVDHCVDVDAKDVEGALEGSGDGSERGECSGEARAQEAIVGAREEQGDAEAEVGDAILEAVGHARGNAASPARRRSDRANRIAIK